MNCFIQKLAPTGFNAQPSGTGIQQSVISISIKMLMTASTINIKSNCKCNNIFFLSKISQDKYTQSEQTRCSQININITKTNL